MRKSTNTLRQTSRLKTLMLLGLHVHGAV